MERIIIFLVSVSGMSATSIRVYYEQKETPEELKNSPSAEGRFIWKQATDALQKEIGHDDYEIVYWDWVK